MSATDRPDPEQMRIGERVETDEYAKDDVRDFALWKGPKPGEPSWETSIGAGRPGWHIECSAMSMRHLGRSFDIHTGGVDLIFPHHEDEIAQSEAATGQPFVRTWLHCAFLQMAGRKMARSAGNIARVDELLERGTPPRALRYALISVHYRMALAFSDESLAAAASAVERLDNVLAALDSYSEEREDDPSLDDVLANGRRSFEEALDVAIKAEQPDSAYSAINNLGVISTRLGSYPDALQYLELGADSLARWLTETGWDAQRRVSRAGYRVLAVSRP